MTATGIVVLVHGSRGKRGRVEVESALERIVDGLRPYVKWDIEIVGAALQFNQPSLEDSIESLSAKQISRIIIVPYFLFAGRHITEHVPQMLSDLQHAHPDTQFLLADNLGLDDYFIGLLAKRVRQAAPDTASRAFSNEGRNIEIESMRIVDSLMQFPDTMKQEEIAVVKRIVHASGDTTIAASIICSDAAISAGIRAISKGSPIITDVRMVLAGIDGHLADGFGCPLYCALDSAETMPLPETANITRTAAAINHLGSKLNGAIVAVGNAPTALLALLALVDSGTALPALIVGMPVGFVKAKESKQELMKRAIPYFTVRGTRGGSSMAAATVNSLLKLASRKPDSNSKPSDRRNPQC
jgi:precorrin-8X/cobalt-precorrin-8 methylmutase